MRVDPANITNRVITFLFIKNLNKKYIETILASAKAINTLAETFKLAHHSLLTLKKYEGLVYNEELKIGEIKQIVDLSEDIGGTGNIKQSNKSALNETNKIHTYWGT